MTLDEVLGALVRLDCRPRAKSQTQWYAFCPAHSDVNRRSLAVGVGRDGGPLLHCYAGCQFAQIIEALDEGRRVMSEFPKVDTTPEPLPDEAQIAQWQDALTPAVANALREWRPWSYGTLQAFGVGYHDKRLTLPMYERGELVNVGTYRPSGKVIGLSHRRKPLYHVPILGTLPSDTPLWIVEGEPDALSAYELGLWAVGVPGVNNWRQEYAQRFIGRCVRVCMDCDRPGREAAYRIFADLVPFASSLKQVDLEPLRDDGYDLTDFLMDARSRNELGEARAYLRWLQDH